MGELHEIPLAELYEKFYSSHYGLSSKQVPILRKHYGYNVLHEAKKTPWIIRFLLQFKNFFSILLLVGAVLSFIGEYVSPNQGNIILAYALLGVTVLNAAFTFFQEYRAEAAMKSFKNLLPQHISVLRNHKEVQILASDLVPGDVIFLREGDKIPADARIIEANNLKVDHSMLTGESEPQLRSAEPSNNKALLSRNMVFSGTLVQSGSGKAFIIKTGDSTEIGSIAKLTTSVKSKHSKIKEELSDFVRVISAIAIVLGVVFFGLGFVIGRTFWESMVFAIGIIVANVPEGLLPTVTLTLSLAGQKMARENALVKDMESIETIGGVTTICTDKTGTLTENSLTVTSIIYNCEEYNFDPQHKTFYRNKKYLHPINDKYFDRLLSAVYLCNNSSIVPEPVGDPTEIALKQMVKSQKSVTHYTKVRREKEIPFDSEKKYMITAQETPNHRIAYLKGSPEVVLKKCTHYIKDNVQKKLTPAIRKRILENNSRLASDGKRVLAAGYFALGSRAATEKYLEINQYVFLGLISLQDPPRKEVSSAVKQCYEAGIRIIVISGDQELTVKSIATQVGIAKEDTRVINSKELNEISDSELKKILHHKSPIIFARSLPSDKLRIVRVLQEQGEIVAVTGDGVNDAPALKQADVGVAMGKSGTDVAKEAANIVLLDDNFATIVKAIKSGRTVFENIKKFILYILTSNIPEILPFLFFVLFGWPLALPILLILAIDLGTDMLPAISLGMERSEKDVMKHPPRSPKQKLLTKGMLARSYGFVGSLQATVAFLMFFTVLFSGGWSWGQEVPAALYASAITAFLASIVITQVFDFLSCRTVRQSAFKKSFKQNKFGILAIGVELTLLAILIFWSPAQRLFGTSPFEPILLLYMVLGGMVLLGVEEVRKYYHRRKEACHKPV